MKNGRLGDYKQIKRPKINLRLLNSFAEATTILKFDGKRKVWIVYCSYYPHITWFVAYAKSRKLRFQLDAGGFRCEMPVTGKEYLRFLPYHTRGSFAHPRNLPLELKRKIMAAVRARQRKYGGAGSQGPGSMTKEVRKIKAEYWEKHPEYNLPGPEA